MLASERGIPYLSQSQSVAHSKMTFQTVFPFDHSARAKSQKRWMKNLAQTLLSSYHPAE